MPAADALFVLLAAIVLDAYAGAPLWRRRWHWQPLIAIDRLTARCAEKLDRESRDPRTLRFRGGAAAAALVGLGAVGGLALEAAAARHPVLWLPVLIVFTGLVDQRESADALRRLGRAIAVGDRPGAEAALARLSMRDPVHLDRFGMARVGIEALTRRLSRRWTAPVLYAAVGGVSGIVAYWLIDGLAAAGGGGGPFGAVPRKLRRIAHWLPDRLTGIVLAASASLSGRGAAFAGLPDATGTDWPASATADALGVSLAGPRHYAGRTVDAPWIGRGRPQAGPNDIVAALGLHRLAVALVSLAVAAAALVRLV